ncbi:MAG: ATPase, partial [Spirochaetaceae bacterium]|nr:ATPase [Spirochaetaceae bacterium]
MDTKQAIEAGKTSLGIEFGSTRIKAVLIDEAYKPIAQGAHDWENHLDQSAEAGCQVWTYPLDEVKAGLQDAYAKLAADVRQKYGIELTTVGSMGVAAMMHGYIAFDKNEKQLAEFRTWRNTITGEAAEELTKKFNFNIPQRWTIAHLYQAMLKGEKHVKDIAYLTTLAGFVHYKLTGEKIVGVGDASGMFPIDSSTLSYDAKMLKQFDAIAAEKGYTWKLEDIFPKSIGAGIEAGSLTAEGAQYLDPSGKLKAGVPFAAPEGDAGTGMTATNSVKKRTGNVSAGTSIFAMAVLEKPLSKVHMEIDMVTTPDGMPVAMVHCNNCTPDLDAWFRIFDDAIKLAGGNIGKGALYDALYEKALASDADCGGLLSYNFFSGEHTIGLNEGRPMVVRNPDSKFTLPNFVRSLIYSTMGTLALGMKILSDEENVSLDVLYGQGGLFKTPVVGQQLMAGALNVPVAVMEGAGEGGPWGMAILAAFMRDKKAGEKMPL